MLPGREGYVRSRRRFRDALRLNCVLFLVPSALRGPLDITQRNHPVPRLAWLLQGLAELRVGDRGPAGLPHQDHI